MGFPGMFGIDPVYMMFLAPGMLLAMWAQYRVQSAYHRARQIPARSGVSGAQAADIVLRDANVPGVQIEPTHGFLSDHYVPGQHVLRLSEDVYAGRSIASLGIAAHEAGHAIQDSRRYPLLVVRNYMVPLASTGGGISMFLIMIGLIIASMAMVKIGIIAFGTTVAFQLVNLPVEFDASRRARQSLLHSGLVSPEEDGEVQRVLNAAAWTYIAGTITSVLTLFYYLFRAGLLGGGNRDE
ncbi:MAG: zinc metallopeptidase [Gemmataceae bacterium]